MRAAVHGSSSTAGKQFHQPLVEFHGGPGGNTFSPDK